MIGRRALLGRIAAALIMAPLAPLALRQTPVAVPVLFRPAPVPVAQLTLDGLLHGIRRWNIQHELIDASTWLSHSRQYASGLTTASWETVWNDRSGEYPSDSMGKPIELDFLPGMAPGTSYGKFVVSSVIVRSDVSGLVVAEFRAESV